MRSLIFSTALAAVFIATPFASAFARGGGMGSGHGGGMGGGGHNGGGFHSGSPLAVPVKTLTAWNSGPARTWAHQASPSPRDPEWT